jgi:hypothetical protein
MLLSETEAERFLNLYKSLLVYVNQYSKLFPKVKTIADLEKRPFGDMYKLREKLYEDTKLFDSFIGEVLAKSNSEEIPTVEAWKSNYIRGQFYLLRFLKNYAIFLTMEEPARAFGVLGLTTPFQEMVHPGALPILVEAVLLPFAGKVVSDGFVAGGNISFGSGMRKSINTFYEEAKARYGIITSLDTPIQESESADSAKLKAYLKTERSREEYWYEIQELKDKSPELKLIYAQEIGKAYARIHGKRFKEIGLKNVWIALFEEMPIATGKTKADVEEVVSQILPSSQQQFVYIFQLKGK